MEGRSGNGSILPDGENLLSIEVTTRCNLNCLHCLVQSEKRESILLSLPLVQDILRAGYDAGYRRLHLTGGEPLLWDSLMSTLGLAFSVGYKSVLINTNGTLLSRDMCAQLGAHDKVFISVSLDGTKESHDRIRGHGQYKRTVEGLANALEAGIPTLIFTTMCKELLPKLPLFTTRLFDRFPSISHIWVIPLMNSTGTDFALLDDLLRPADFVRLIQGILLLNGFGFRVGVLNEPLAYVAADLMGRPLKQWAPPVNSEKSIIVKADGTIGLSHFSKIDFGPYKTGKLQEVLVSDRYKEAVSSDETICPACRYHTVCARQGMKRPSGSAKYSQENALYCKCVLDIISEGKGNLREGVVPHA
jgi:MoaA/NifB/PqqE/SkfB family radical SAM enzyme